MLELAMVVFSDRGSGVLGIGGLEGVSLSEFLECDVEAGAEHVGCTKLFSQVSLTSYINWRDECRAEHTMIADMTKSVPMTAAKR